MSVNSGAKTSFGVGDESTWGTAVSRTHWMGMKSISIVRTVEREYIPCLSVDGRNVMRNSVEKSNKASGTIETFLKYESGVLKLLEYAFGTVANAGSGPYTHTFTLSEDNPPAFTGSVTREMPANSSGAYSEVFEGCLVSKLTISGSANELVMVSADIIGQTSGGRVSADTPSVTYESSFAHGNHITSFTHDGDSYELKSFTLTIDHQLEERPVMGSASTGRPTRGQATVITLEVELDETNNNLYDAVINGTSSDAVLSLSHTGNFAMTITLHNARASGEAPGAVSDRGVTAVSTTFRPDADANDDITIVVTNDDATLTN